MAPGTFGAPALEKFISKVEWGKVFEPHSAGGLVTSEPRANLCPQQTRHMKSV